MLKPRLYLSLLLLVFLAGCDWFGSEPEVTSDPSAKSPAEAPNAEHQPHMATDGGIGGGQLLLGSVLALNGPAQELGQGMKNGLTTALEGQAVAGQKLHILFEDDRYEPAVTTFKVKRLIKKGIFLMVGDVGTPTAKVSLPMLNEANVPAVGFFTGAGLLRTGEGPVLNYRASYIQETAAVIDAALAAGVKPEQVCTYVQNDAYGGAGVAGVQQALQRADAPQPVLAGLEAFFANRGTNTLVKTTGRKTPINNNGPIGVYTRNTLDIKAGYKSLKLWEAETGYRCRLVVSVGAYSNIARFVKYSRDNGESWVVSAVSFTGADAFGKELKKLGVTENIVMTQVVPLLDSDLPIVDEAKAALGKDFGFVSLEGYIVGKMLLKLLRETPAPLSRENFVDQSRQAKFNLGGVTIDFTRNGYQGSDLVEVSHLTDEGYEAANQGIWREMLLSRIQ